MSDTTNQEGESKETTWAVRIIIASTFAFMGWWLQNQWIAFSEFKDYAMANHVQRIELESHVNSQSHPELVGRVQKVETTLQFIRETLLEIKADVKEIKVDAEDEREKFRDRERQTPPR